MLIHGQAEARASTTEECPEDACSDPAAHITTATGHIVHLPASGIAGVGFGYVASQTQPMWTIGYFSDDAETWERFDTPIEPWDMYRYPGGTVDSGMIRGRQVLVDYVDYSSPSETGNGGRSGRSVRISIDGRQWQQILLSPNPPPPSSSLACRPTGVLHFRPPYLLSRQ